MILYRPVGLIELQLIFESNLTAFPPRLPEQPIFYPVTNPTYAEQIARDWNTKTSPFAGYVTEFTIDDAYLAQYQKQIVGGRLHEEYWIPAERLTEFNHHLTSPIQVIKAFFGHSFQGYIPQKLGFKGKNATAQFALLCSSFDYSPMDFTLEIRANRTAVFLNYPFWQQTPFTELGISAEQQERVLEAIQQVWQQGLSHLPLPTSSLNQ